MEKQCFKERESKSKIWHGKDRTRHDWYYERRIFIEKTTKQKENNVDKYDKHALAEYYKIRQIEILTKRCISSFN